MVLENVQMYTTTRLTQDDEAPACVYIKTELAICSFTVCKNNGDV